MNDINFGHSDCRFRLRMARNVWKHTSEVFPTSNCVCQNFSTIVAVLSNILVLLRLGGELLVHIWDHVHTKSIHKVFVHSDLAVTSIYPHLCSGLTHDFLLNSSTMGLYTTLWQVRSVGRKYCKFYKTKINLISLLSMSYAQETNR